ncbi:hypothetical protein LI328DRAFT_160486 [Trichoderma asperelloides]|nr:hypothetical protein LI328DRAFT_160486 [Trichoderma asperelloides]
MKMSSSGGFYKYRCKNFYSHNCPNWVWVNNSPCATCIAEGKDASERPQSSSTTSREIVTPRVRDGILQYTIAELVAPSASGESWALRDKFNGIVDDGEPPEALPMMGNAMPFSQRPKALWQF